MFTIPWQPNYSYINIANAYILQKLTLEAEDIIYTLYIQLQSMENAIKYFITVTKPEIGDTN